jgi:hypothetical protein
MISVSSILCNADRQRNATRPITSKTLISSSQQGEQWRRDSFSYNLIRSISVFPSPRCQSRMREQHPAIACMSVHVVYIFDRRVLSEVYRDSGRRPFEMMDIE